MSTLQAIGILVIFLAGVILMMTRKLPTILALPIMAILIAVVSGVPLYSNDDETFSITQNILQAGALRMATAITGVIFGGWFGKVLMKTGIANTIVRKAGELAGDHPLPVALVFLAVCSVIFAASDGIGIIILVGTIAIPIMISAGMDSMLAGMVILFSEGIGASFNVGDLGIYMDSLSLPQATVTKYSFLCALPVMVVALVYLIYNLQIKKKTRKAWAMPAAEKTDETEGGRNVRAVALISPLIPVILIFAFQVQLVPAILVGIIIAVLLSTPKKPIQLLASSFVEGLQSTAGAIVLMIGIGMVLVSVMSPQVSAVLSPAIKAIIPTTPILFVLVFGLLCPLAIYRGPLNVWGLGSGIVALLAASGMNPVAAMLALRLDSNVQDVCDPTNTHNAWVADFTHNDVNDYLKKTIPWIAISTVAGLIIASFIVY